ncbi:hypothetical protein DNC80_15215 [Flavobacterium sp. SOK18b]|uniref:hypothetical protein n=1 Tax=Flavobacterium sp. SOK18b TaxID=797900 RepID=UPI0015F967CA|nr:hypothetical protein [Flavobacterium sp. SOK18b]MBB1195014.1 hypothetical protein [Flavobacterium sp. SOK18b]
MTNSKTLITILALVIKLNLNAQMAPSTGEKVLEVKETYEGEFLKTVSENSLSSVVTKAITERVPKKLEKYGFTNITLTEVGQVNEEGNWKFQVNFIDNISKHSYKVRINMMYSPQYIIKESNLSKEISKISGHERVNRQKLIFNSSSDIMTKATGWSYNSTLGEWIDYENVISSEKIYKNELKNSQGEYMMSRATSFLNISTKSLIYNNIYYYVLIIERWNGAFKYPALRENWYTFKQTNGYIFTKSDYLKLQKLEGSLILQTPNFVYMGSNIEKYDETKFLDLIQTELAKNKDNNSNQYALFVTKPKEGIIRFNLSDYYIANSTSILDKEYFETEIENFSKILIE